MKFSPDFHSIDYNIETLLLSSSISIRVRNENNFNEASRFGTEYERNFNENATLYYNLK